MQRDTSCSQSSTVPGESLGSSYHPFRSSTIPNASAAPPPSAVTQPTPATNALLQCILIVEVHELPYCQSKEHPRRERYTGLTHPLKKRTLILCSFRLPDGSEPLFCAAQPYHRTDGTNSFTSFPRICKRDRIVNANESASHIITKNIPFAL
ncbi:hypothetical protein AOLI_G00254610 [Acnodon oligacanthus]